MTVDRTIIECFKAADPDAFSLDMPDVSTVFIDGQLKMQCPGGIYTWQDFFEALYRRMIQKYLATEGVQVVILAFDNHNESPKAKGPTQSKRCSRATVPNWNVLQPLPPIIPANYAELLLSRLNP
jgi:hypothetical protein